MIACWLRISKNCRKRLVACQFGVTLLNFNCIEFGRKNDGTHGPIGRPKKKMPTKHTSNRRKTTNKQIERITSHLCAPTTKPMVISRWAHQFGAGCFCFRCCGFSFNSIWPNACTVLCQTCACLHIFYTLPFSVSSSLNFSSSRSCIENHFWWYKIFQHFPI